MKNHRFKGCGVDGQLVDYAYYGRTQVYYTLDECSPLTPLLLFVLDLSYKLFLHCYAAVGNILTDTLHHNILSYLLSLGGCVI